MKKLTKLESFGLITAILVGGSYFYMQRVYDPETKSLQKTVAKLNKTIKEYNKLEEPPSPLRLQKEIEKLNGELDVLVKELKDSGGRTGALSEITEVLAEVSTKAKNENMQVIKIVPGKNVQDDLFTWKAVNIQLLGHFSDFVHLVTRLQEMSRPLQIRELTINRSDDLEDEVIITATLWV